MMTGVLNTTKLSNHFQRARCAIVKGVLRNFLKFTGKHQCQSLFFNKVASLRPATLFKKRLWHKCFPLNFVKFPRTTFLQYAFVQLLLSESISNLYLRNFEICERLLMIILLFQKFICFRLSLYNCEEKCDLLW